MPEQFRQQTVLRFRIPRHTDIRSRVDVIVAIEDVLDVQLRIQIAAQDAGLYRDALVDVSDIAEAVGNATRFQALLQEYQKAPDVTRSRIYLDSMEKILPKVKLYVIDSQGGRVPINLRVTAPGSGEK
jgi:regulator of protease activity HflC (stomatin/prohibitin superfamily)